MKVSLINYTQDAMELLLFTKQTRLEMNPSLLDEIKNEWSDAKKDEELRYMSRTIPSSWEFVNYVFSVQDVTRAFTHQLVRTRTGKYAQQTMRIARMSSRSKAFNYRTGPSIARNAAALQKYQRAMQMISSAYSDVMDDGAEAEDARGLLPTNIHTNIIVGFDLRTIADLCRKRGSVRTQDEYREFIVAMKAAVYAVHPWAAIFIEPKYPDTVARLEKLAEQVRAFSIPLSNEIAKEAEIIKQEAS